MLQPPSAVRAAIGLAGLLGSSAAPAPSQTADLVVYGRVWTGDSARPWARAVAISGNKITQVGDSASVARMAGPATKVLGGGRGNVGRLARLTLPGQLSLR